MRDSILHCLVGRFIAHGANKFFGSFLGQRVIRAVPVFMPGPCPLNEGTGSTRQKIADDIRALLDLRVQGANREFVEAIERICCCHDTHQRLISVGVIARAINNYIYTLVGNSFRDKRSIARSHCKKWCMKMHLYERKRGNSIKDPNKCLLIDNRFILHYNSPLMHFYCLPAALILGPEAMKRVIAQTFPTNPSLRTPVDLGAALRSARTTAGLSLDDAALGLGISKKTLLNLERGAPSVPIRTALTPPPHLSS